MAKVTALASSSAAQLRAAKITTKIVETKHVTIKPPDFAQATVEIVNLENSPLVMNAFSSANRDSMLAKQKEGSAASKTRKAKPPKDFEKIYQSSMHKSTEGWYGFPAAGFRAALIEATR